MITKHNIEHTHTHTHIHTHTHTFSLMQGPGYPNMMFRPPMGMMHQHYMM